MGIEFCLGWSWFNSRCLTKRRCQVTSCEYQEEMFRDVCTTKCLLVRSLELWREVGTGDLYLEVFRIQMTFKDEIPKERVSIEKREGLGLTLGQGPLK